MIKVKFKTAITTQNVFRSQGCDKKWEKTPFITYKIRSSDGEIIQKNVYNNMR